MRADDFAVTLLMECQVKELMTLSDGLLSSKFAVAARGLAFLVWSLVLVILVHSARAQDNVGDESTIRYPAEYFVDFNPMTAQDLSLIHI